MRPSVASSRSQSLSRLGELRHSEGSTGFPRGSSLFFRQVVKLWITPRRSYPQNEGVDERRDLTPLGELDGSEDVVDLFDERRPGEVASYDDVEGEGSAVLVEELLSS